MERPENSLKAATRLARDLMVRQSRPLTLLFVVACLISLQLQDAIRVLGPTDDGSRWLLQLTMVVWDLSEGAIAFLIMSWGIPKVHMLSAANLEKQPFGEAYVSSFLAEYLRMYGIVIVAGLFLLIPGFVAYALLMFVPYIALFSKPYRADQVSALKYSLRLTRKHFGPIFGVFLATAALQLVCEFLPHMYVPLYTIPSRIAFMALSLLIGIWTYCFMFLIFERAVTGDEDGFDV